MKHRPAWPWERRALKRAWWTHDVEVARYFADLSALAKKYVVNP